MIDFSRNHFALFGLPERYRFDADALDRAYRALQSDVHPDRHAAADDQQRRLSLQASARVNEAYRTLKDRVGRAEYLLQLRGVDPTAGTDTALPFEFLERQLERREAADHAVGAGDGPALDALQPIGPRRVRGDRGEAPRTPGPRRRLHRGPHAGARAAVPGQARCGHRRDGGGPRRLMPWNGAPGRAARTRKAKPMALLQISEPDASPLPHERQLAVGIDLGTTNSLVATVRNGIPVVLPDEEGRPLLPSIVRYAPDGVARRPRARRPSRRATRRTPSSRSSA